MFISSLVVLNYFIYCFVYTPGISTDPFALVGPVCNVATDLLATIVDRYFNAVQVSYGVDSPAFSDVNTYSYLYSTVPVYTEYVRTIAVVLEHFNWQVIGLVVQTDKIQFTRSAEDFLSATSSNFRISTVLSWVGPDRLTGGNSRESVRIFIAFVDEAEAADMMCAAFKDGLTGSKFVWILLGEFLEGWWRSLHVLDCTEEEMLSAVESTLILTNSVQISRSTFNSIRQQNQSEFWREFRDHLQANTGLDFDEERALRVLPAYDAVWSITKALITTLEQYLSLPSSDIGDKNRHPLATQIIAFHQKINNNMKNISFQGTAGKIKFTKTSNSPQSPVTSIFQMQNGTIVPVGTHTPDQSVVDFTFFGNNLSWQGEGPPRDRPVLVFQVVELWIIVIMLILTALGIAYAIVILIVNCVYRKHQVIKASSPYINILIIIGCILGLLIIPVLSIENLDTGQMLPEIVYLIFCNARVWMIVLSLTLAFGALFAKTWRVYMIFRNPWAKARPYKDHVLLLIVGVLLLVDVIVLSIVTGRIHLTLKVFTFPSPSDQFTRNGYRICLDGENLFTPSPEFSAYVIVVTIMKLVLFLFGIFLVFQTRKIKAKYFQDARFIGMAVYGTVIACGVGFSLSMGLMLFLQEDVGFVCASVTILFCSFFILSAVFIPRFVLLRKYKKKVPSAVLLELNPSFRIRRSNPKQSTRLNRKTKFSHRINRVEETTSTLIRTPNLSNASTNAVANCNDLLQESENTVWEPAYVTQEEASYSGQSASDDDSKNKVSHSTCVSVL